MVHLIMQLHRNLKGSKISLSIIPKLLIINDLRTEKSRNNKIVSMTQNATNNRENQRKTEGPLHDFYTICARQNEKRNIQNELIL